MTDNIQNIFNMNKELLGWMDKAVIYFRRGEYDKALSIIVDSTENIHVITDAIIKDREYFNLVSTESVVEMLSGIVEAQKNRDYVLLADLIELQMLRFISNVQELIMNKEDSFVFDQSSYEHAIDLLLKRILNYEETYACLKEELNPGLLLEKGYRVEFTSCGQMTLAVTDPQENSYYMHTNHMITGEAFIHAVKWHKVKTGKYIIFGFGMGYIIKELLMLIEKDDIESTITVYEPDINILKLVCAFSGIEDIFSNPKLNIVYDPEYYHIKEAIAKKNNNDRICIFYPAFRYIRNDELKELLVDYLPWALGI